MELCEGTVDYLVKSSSHMTAAIVIIILYLAAEAFCVYSAIRVIRKVDLGEEMILIPIIVTLNITLIFRVLYFFGGLQPFCYYSYWYYYFNDLAALSKDMCLLCLLVRVWEYLSSLESADSIYQKNTKYTYVFMVAHFLIGYIFMLIEDSEAVDDILFHYLGGVQIILLFVFSYAFYKLFFALRENAGSSVEKEVLIMNAVSIVVIITILARTIYDLGILDTEWGTSTQDIVVFVFSVVSELLPCVLVTFILFFQKENLTDAVLRGSSFSKHNI